MNRLVIDLLNIEKGKAYGYQEYIFNLLAYFYQHRDEILYDRIIIWCKSTAAGMFDDFKDKFEIAEFTYSSYLKRHWLQTVLPIKYRLNGEDLLFSPGNISGVIKCSKEILTIHDLLYKRKRWLPNKMMRWQRELLIPISIKKADRIIAISQFTKADIEYYYPQAKGKIEVIYNSFNFNKYNSEKIFDLGYKYFLSISTSIDYKNQKTILDAFCTYCNKGGENRLVIVSKLNKRSEAANVYNSLPQSIKNRIMWKSHISNSELGELYRGASCFVSASKFEGLGMPVVEAMSFGIPVLLSDIPPHREVSMNKGEYFEATNVVELAEKMLKIDFRKQNYSSEIRKIYSQEHTSVRYIKMFNAIYTETHNLQY